MRLSALQVMSASVELGLIAKKEVIELLDRARKDNLEHFDLLSIGSRLFEDADLHL